MQKKCKKNAGSLATIEKNGTGSESVKVPDFGVSCHNFHSGSAAVMVTEFALSNL